MTLVVGMVLCLRMVSGCLVSVRCLVVGVELSEVELIGAVRVVGRSDSCGVLRGTVQDWPEK